MFQVIAINDCPSGLTPPNADGAIRAEREKNRELNSFRHESTLPRNSRSASRGSKMGPTVAYPTDPPNPAEFLTLFPEFKGANVDLIQGTLSGAAVSLSAETFGPQYGIAVAYLAAHRLALSPWGNASKLLAEGRKGPARTTTYMTHFEMIRDSVTAYGVVP